MAGSVTLARVSRFAKIKLGLRCCGDCCRRFPLPHTTYEDILESARRTREKLPPVPGKNYQDDTIVADMIIPLGKFPNTVTGVPMMYYKCRHLKENGDCGNYAGRPALCRNYPYGRKCEHKTCNWKALRLKLWLDGTKRWWRRYWAWRFHRPLEKIKRAEET